METDNTRRGFLLGGVLATVGLVAGNAHADEKQPENVPTAAVGSAKDRGTLTT